MKSQAYNIKVYTQIWTYDGDFYEIPISITNWLKKVEADKKIGKKSIFLKKYEETLYFANIKKEKGRVKHIALPEPKKRKSLIQMSSTEKQNFRDSNPEAFYKQEQEEQKARQFVRKQIQEHRKKAAEKLKKEFIIEREKILKRLAYNEKKYGLTTTLEKIEYAELYKKSLLKGKLK